MEVAGIQFSNETLVAILVAFVVVYSASKLMWIIKAVAQVAIFAVLVAILAQILMNNPFFRVATSAVNWNPQGVLEASRYAYIFVKTYLTS